MRSALVVASMLALAACAGDGSPTTSSAAGTTSAPSAATSTLPPVVDCPGVGEFEEGGGIADIDSESSDSRIIGRISWETSDLCETFHLDFETSEGAPATTVPAIRVDHLESYQVVRITMDVQATVVTDQLVETNLVDRLYVVRSLSGGMFVDLHLASPASVRAAVSSSPARLGLDLRPGLVPFAGRSAIEDDIVLTSPVAGADTDATVQLLGYSRTFEGNVLVVVSQNGETVTETITTAADWVDTWGEYRAQVSLPAGDVSVFVGDASPEDGSLEGITLDLSVS